jgi:hypothetical protein
VEEIDDGLALVHVAWQPDIVELCGFFCLEADNVYFADLPVFTVCTVCYNPFYISKPRVQLYFPHMVYVPSYKGVVTSIARSNILPPHCYIGMYTMPSPYRKEELIADRAGLVYLVSG